MASGRRGDDGAGEEIGPASAAIGRFAANATVLGSYPVAVP